eukprot:TRINITY_DN2578_c0_g1_i4.p1 TRINITY_DN2578_c0_g1~~TRINITY_DN2578_c0_g1_i4.p1  ORF type:complete len:594 (+),score=100.47 TRINITY_DN2578_c0_g1_i4:95-1876(+)
MLILSYYYGLLIPRDSSLDEKNNTEQEDLDIYFFSYADDYFKCLRDFASISGCVPLLPVDIFGLWWSKYWAYNENDILKLVQDFKDHELPLSTLSIDMDWHLVEESPTSRGWTGYTWNKKLFPDPSKLLNTLHEHGIKRVCLNIHPHEGVHQHEDAFKEFSSFLGIETKSADEFIEFDVTNPKYMEAYFKYLHHPHEAIGVDFWWIDWQQGPVSKVKGLDPLWWLNHLHYLDTERDNKRSLILSRWPGLGGHRYPIGFSGDSVAGWRELSILPMFTSTSSNVLFTWWSHDVGGFMWAFKGYPELYIRWVQMSAFLPVFRFHSICSEYEQREPWAFGKGEYYLAKEAIDMRSDLLPYFYSINYKTHTLSIPINAPLYYYHPTDNNAYYCNEQFYFGTELILSPCTTPVISDLKRSRKVTYFPEGLWFNFFSGKIEQGPKFQVQYWKLEDIPLFAKAGAIVPLLNNRKSKITWGFDDLCVYVFPGGNNTFELYEDDGETLNYRKGEYNTTTFEVTWVCFDKENIYKGGMMRFSVCPSKVHNSEMKRNLHLRFKAIFSEPNKVNILLNKKELDAKVFYYSDKKEFTVEGLTLCSNV